MLSIALLTLISLTSVSYISGEDAPQEQVQEHTEKIDRVVKGDVFIIPNTIVSSTVPNNIVGSTRPDLELGSTSEQPFLEIWVTTKGCKKIPSIIQNKKGEADTKGSPHWAIHGHPELVHDFPRWLPLSLFVDENGVLKKEGDTVTIWDHNPKTSELVQIELTLRQNDYRYRRCGDGKFDECIRSLRDYTRVALPYLSALSTRNRSSVN